MKKNVVLQVGFLAGAFVFWEKFDLEKTEVFGSAFRAMAFVF